VGEGKVDYQPYLPAQATGTYTYLAIEDRKYEASFRRAVEQRSELGLFRERHVLVLGGGGDELE